MNIRARITLWFITSVGLIIVLASILIYIFSADYREDEYYKRLRNNAINTAKLLIEVEEVDLNLLRKIETDNPLSLENEKISVFDSQNHVLYTTDEHLVIDIDSSLLSRIRTEEEVQYRQGEYEVLGFLFHGQHDRFAIVTAATDIYGFNKLSNLRIVLLIVFAISILVATVSGWFFAGKALQPISGVVRQVDDIGISSLNLRVDEGNGRDEIAQLSRTFNLMLERLETSFNVQKDFIANASHELRTPLTSITGQLEVALLNNRTTEEYQKVVASVLDDIKSLNRLSNRLLMLAQAESNQGKITLLRIDELVWQAHDELVRHNPNYSIRIDLDSRLDDEQKLTIEGDEQLIKTAISNIMENGCKYSDNHAVELLITANEFSLLLEFRDQGIGIPAEDLASIFEPFHRGSNTKNTPGNGIGLSIVKRIVDSHGAKLAITSELGSGTRVTLSLPFSS